VSPVDVRPLMTTERMELLGLLGSLDEDGWNAPGPVPGWRVKDIALHVLDDDLGWLSQGRDRDASGLLDATGDYREFVTALNQKNQAWVDGARGLSRRVVIDMLGWTGRQVDDYLGTVDLGAATNVIWAGLDPVPLWFDLARGLTERWVHHRQICEALGSSSRQLDEYLDVVLRTFVWAYPHQYDAEADPGTCVAIDLGDDREFVLTRMVDGWELDEATADSAAARIAMSGEIAWRLLTGAAYDSALVDGQGDHDLVRAGLKVRAIIV